MLILNQKAFWNNVKRGIITPIPIGTLTDLCSIIVITAKKNGKPKRTVDSQHLNSHNEQETHHTSSPFQQVLQAPPNTKKTVLDAVDGYHSIPLDEESQPLITSIMEWGHFMYLRMPQEYLASGDAYTQSYNKIIKDVPRKVKIVNDILLFDKNIEEAFYHTLDYVLLCEKNGIILNRENFNSACTYSNLEAPNNIVRSDPLQKFTKCNLQFPGPQKISPMQGLGLG